MSQTNISIKNIKWHHWVILTAYLALAIVGLWQFYLPFKAERHYRDGYNFLALKRYKFAVEELESAVKTAPWETHYQIQLGKAYEEIAKKHAYQEQKIAWYKKAITLYTKTIQLDGKNPWHKNRMAVVYYELGKLEPEKLDYYLQLADQKNLEAATSDKNNPLFQLNYAYFLHRHPDKSKLEDAKKYYYKVIEMDPALVEASYNLADIHRRENNLEEALKLYENVKKHQPYFKNINMAIAGILIGLRRPQDSIPYLEDQLTYTPDNIEALKNLAGLYHSTQQWPKAVTAYKRIIELDPNTTQSVHQFYMQALVSSGQLFNAIPELKEFLKKDPKNKVAQNQLNLLEDYIKKLKQNGELLKLKQKAQTILQNTPNNTTIQTQLNIINSYLNQR